MVSQSPQGTWGRTGNTATQDVFPETLGALESHMNGKVKAEMNMHPLSTPLLSLTGEPDACRGTGEVNRQACPRLSWGPHSRRQAVWSVECFESGSAGPQGSSGENDII